MTYCRAGGYTAKSEKDKDPLVLSATDCGPCTALRRPTHPATSTCPASIRLEPSGSRMSAESVEYGLYRLLVERRRLAADGRFGVLPRPKRRNATRANDADPLSAMLVRGASGYRGHGEDSRNRSPDDSGHLPL